MVFCCAFGCTNSSDKGFLMKRFPADPERRKVWAANVKRKNWTPTYASRLCEVHFLPEMFEKNRADGKRMLRWNAIPTIFSHIPKKRKSRKPPAKRCSPKKKKITSQEDQSVSAVDMCSTVDPNVDTVGSAMEVVLTSSNSSTSNVPSTTLLPRLKNRVSLYNKAYDASDEVPRIKMEPVDTEPESVPVHYLVPSADLAAIKMEPQDTHLESEPADNLDASDEVLRIKMEPVDTEPESVPADNLVTEIDPVEIYLKSEPADNLDASDEVLRIKMEPEDTEPESVLADYLAADNGLAESQIKPVEIYITSEPVNNIGFQSKKTSKKKFRRSSPMAPLRLTGRHFPKTLPEKKVRTCHVCSKRKNIRKRTRYYCKECDMPLCVDPCFEIFHTVKNI